MWVCYLEVLGGKALCVLQDAGSKCGGEGEKGRLVLFAEQPLV